MTCDTKLLFITLHIITERYSLHRAIYLSAVAVNQNTYCCSPDQVLIAYLCMMELAHTTKQYTA